ncbi:MAG TPA: hypothetical protein VK994_01255, partial [Bacteroidales bacterium]|nr:hypothetical protein [Bacteroidales bacterium]
LRIKIKSNGDDKHRKLPKKDKNARKDYVFRLKLEQVNENTAIQIIDWIVFRKEMEEISFFNEKLHSL